MNAERYGKWHGSALGFCGAFLQRHSITRLGNLDTHGRHGLRIRDHYAGTKGHAWFGNGVM
jgi:hypothetical protein